MSRTYNQEPYEFIEAKYGKESHSHHYHFSNTDTPCDIEKYDPKNKFAYAKVDYKSVTPKNKKKYQDHLNSGACKKYPTATYTCNHDIFGESINYGCLKTIGSYSRRNNKLFMHYKGYSYTEIHEWARLNGICFTHEVTTKKYYPYEPCKCDNWIINRNCDYTLDTRSHPIKGSHLYNNCSCCNSFGNEKARKRRRE